MMRARIVPALAAALLLALPAAGDWLITRDGTRIETDGPWRVKGSQVIFTRPGGGLSALRAADVDLEASAAETNAAGAAEKVESPEPAPDHRAKRPLRVFTNDTVGQAAVEDRDSEDLEGEDLEVEDAQGEDPEGEDPDSDAAVRQAAPEPTEPVELVSWSSRDTGDGLELRGTLRNTGRGFAAGVELTVTVAGDEDEPPFETRAFLDASALAPGAATGFRVPLPGILALAEDPSFTVRSEGFTVGRPASPSSGEDDAEEGGEDFVEPEDGSR